MVRNKYLLMYYAGDVSNEPQNIGSIPFNQKNPFYSDINNNVFSYTVYIDESVTDTTITKFRIMYIPALDDAIDSSHVYKSGELFMFMTPAFHVGQGFDLTPANMTYESNASLLAVIGNKTVQPNDKLLVYQSQDGTETIRSGATLQQARNTPELNSNPGTYYFGGNIGIESTSEDFVYKFWEDATNTLHNLDHDGSIPTTTYPLDKSPYLIGSNYILGVPTAPVIFNVI